MKHFSEETIVDFIMGNLNDEQVEKMNQHLNQCSACQQIYDYWEQSLSMKQNEAPRPAIQAKLLQTIDEKAMNSKYRKWKTPKFITAIAATLILMSIGLYQIVQDGPNNQSTTQYITAQHDSIPEHEFLENPDTNRLDILPVTTNSNVKSDVWLNEVTNEMMLFVDGLVPLEQQDYQLWLVHSNNNWNGDILQLRNGKARVYYKMGDITELKLVKVSVEPLGGSLTPTGPETFYIDLNN
ncbi:anti-sigma factor [Ornithinibacillus halophilus]|uniref:Anti-sigma-K factor RskA n=1 Tax=Ornithinibacillus halophilus TaxID=930117 RepID=A0A1M5HZ05_9BACI|nr:anti-sigma factor [Ornithinibacillus halophilus]SHG21102.1 Anti-sigma-K factor RskA [Ornithinibacillus halophilus]